MDRRAFVSGITVGLLSVPLAAEAQQAGKVNRLGFLSPLSSSGAAPDEQAFREGLRDLGWVEGKNIRIDYRHAEGRNERRYSTCGGSRTAAAS
jgi:putative tryptophan/tyrosine transport system substrate-binding protein